MLANHLPSSNHSDTSHRASKQARSASTTLASVREVLCGSVRGLLVRSFLVRVCEATHRGDLVIRRGAGGWVWAMAMAGRGGRQGSFGGIGTGASSAGGAGPSYGAFSGSGSASREQEFPQVADSRGRGGSGGGRGDSGGADRGAHRGGRGDRGGYGGRGGRPVDSIDALGRCMTAILRHRASDYDLEMKNDGFVLVADLLKLSKRTGAGIALSSHSEEDVRKAVAADGKQRFGLKEESGKLYIRANQGHSIKTVESGQLLSLITSPSQIAVCVHGTYHKFMSSIWQEGLKRMTRNHVHFATGLPKEDGVISGMRASAQVLIYLDVEKAMEDGMQLYVSANNVVLTEGFDGVVPTKYFKRVVKKLPNGRETTLFHPNQPPVNTTTDAPRQEKQE